MKGNRSSGRIPLMPVESIIKSVSHRDGINRVSVEAVKVLRDVLEEKGKVITKEAAKLAGHAKRKTIKQSDIELAIVH